MSKRKRYRFWLRTAVLIALFSAVGFAFYQNLTPANKKNGLGLNEQAPNFKLTTLNGEEIELNKLKGKAVLVNFGEPGANPVKEKCLLYKMHMSSIKIKNLKLLLLTFKNQMSQ
ncbi:redoxin domain-containing protein [Bacillus licheniformis]